MFIIGERINGMFKDVADALAAGDKGVIQSLALRQIEAGANALDINVGPASPDPMSAMEWLVSSVREVTDIHLAIDTTKADVMEKGLSLCRGKGIINSVNGDEEKLSVFLPLAKKYSARLIGLTMNKKGIPKDSASRTEIALNILTACQEQGIAIEDLFIDAVILPVNVAQDHCKEVLETIKSIKILSDPAPRTILGLSNVSQKTLNRPLVNRVFLIMAVGCGLDSAILDPMDRDLMDAVITSELLLNKNIYCDNFLEAYRKK